MPRKQYISPTKAYCLEHKSIAYYSGFGGIEIKAINHGISDCVYYVASAWYGGESAKTYHCKRIYYPAKASPYFLHNGNRIPLDECIRM